MELLPTSAAAKMLGVSEGTLRYWRYMDQGPRSFRIGRHVKYRQEDIEEWLNGQLISTARGGIGAGV